MTSHTISMETHSVVLITAMSQDFCVLDCSLKVSVPQLQNFLNVPTTFDFFCLNNNFQMKKIWCLKTQLWSKVIFSKSTQGYAVTSAWFVHVTNFCSSGKRNLNKFFSNYKTAFCSKSPILWCDFEQLWLCLFDRNTCKINRLFSYSEKKRLRRIKLVILEPCDYGNQCYLEKTLKIVQCHPSWR